MFQNGFFSLDKFENTVKTRVVDLIFNLLFYIKA
jgi:hypothetical protein